MSTLTTTLVSTISTATTPTSFASGHRRGHRFPVTPHHVDTHFRSFPLLHVANDANKEVTTNNIRDEIQEVDKILDGMEFGEICNEFECISSPSIESTARQLARDILELREGNRALGTYATSVIYKDPVRSFSGREKYKRPLWVTKTLENTKVGLQEMVMLSTSVLNIKWTLKGKPKSVLGSIGGELIINVNSKFTLNQISGQVIEHEETWDLSKSSPIAQAYFWVSRRLFSVKETGQDVIDSVKNIGSKFSSPKEDIEVYPDPSGDPTKFFQRDDGFQRDVYQIALFLALVYLVVQYLRTTL